MICSALEVGNFVKNNEGQNTAFDIGGLPKELIELIMGSLSTRDIINLFKINTTMRQLFKRVDSNALWIQILKNSKISLEGDIMMSTQDIKKYVLNAER